MSLNPADIRNKRFRTVLLRSGYHQDDVDALLDRVEATLAALNGGPMARSPVTSGELDHAQFRPTRRGYDPVEVDAFIEEAADELRRSEEGG